MLASTVDMIGHGAGVLVMAAFWLTPIVLAVSCGARALSERREERAPARRRAPGRDRGPRAAPEPRARRGCGCARIRA